MTEEALRAAGYQAPTLSADKALEWDALQASVDATSGAHPCRGCGNKLLPNQPNGAYCRRCAEELACLFREENAHTCDWQMLAAGVIGFAVGVFSSIFIYAIVRSL